MVKLIPVRSPEWLKKATQGLVWNFETDQKEVYLTFDDGPTPVITNWTLDLLGQYDAKATFFCVGNQVISNPAIFDRIINEGHAIGNHSNDHLKGWKVSTKLYLENIDRAAISIPSKLFRPPYGQITPAQVKALQKEGYDIIMWSLLSKDWDNSLDGEVCTKNVISRVKPGDIVVFHDSVKAKKNLMFALPKVLDELKGRGYRFKRIPELAR
ncbi:MAG: polysaccharide deacetylase family protein [Flavobacteriaceae bacterium]|nr:polysaccharide deacetylase family protein [Flavobacteriaceae bacterium]